MTDMNVQIITLLFVLLMIPFIPLSFAEFGDFLGELVLESGSFSAPFGVAVDSTGRIIVSDPGAALIRVFDVNEDFLFSFNGGNNGGTRFQYPVSVAVDSYDNIIVTDIGNDTIQVFNSEGKFIFKVDDMNRTIFSDPVAVAVDSYDNIIVTDGYLNSVLVFYSDGSFNFSFNGSEGGGIEFQRPYGIAVNHTNNNIIVTDVSKGLVQVFSSDGKFLFSFDGSEGDGKKFEQPYGVAVGVDNRILVVDEGLNLVQVFSSDGTFIDSFDGTDNNGTKFSGPAGIAVDSNNNIIVADTGNRKVQIFECNPIEPNLDPSDDLTEDETELESTDITPVDKNGGCADCTPPTLGINPFFKRVVDNGFSYNGNSVQVETWYTKFPLITAQVGNINIVEIIVYENSGKSYLKMVQFGLGATGIGQPLNNLEVLIAIYIEASANTINDHDLRIEKVIIKDKDNLIDTYTVFAIVDDVMCMDDSYNEACVKVTLQYSYREATINNIMVVSVSDWARNTQIFYFNDGVEVVGESLNEPPTYIMHNKHTSQQTEDLTLTLTRTDKVNHIWIDKYDIEYLQISENRFEYRSVENTK